MSKTNNNVTLYWQNRYEQNNSPWNAQKVTTPIKEYIDQLSDQSIRILIPGVGHGHELHYLYKRGFNHIKGLDLTGIAAQSTFEVHKDFPIDKVVIGDFFTHKGKYDLILEQTFFCAIPREQRIQYVEKMKELLTENGKLVGVLFDTEFDQQSPPFGGGYQEYFDLFNSKMNIKTMERAYNSIPPRANRELFIIIENK
ncbi:class I SAM-dependent methyltransferase [Myroides sp. LJL115]